MLDMPVSVVSILLNIIIGLVTSPTLMHTASIQEHKQLYCLAANSYWESRGESLDDKIATAQVVMNRVDSRKYPDDICSVITQGPKRESWKTKQDPTLSNAERKYYPIRNRCQFSWYCDGRSDMITNLDGWEDSVIAAYLVYIGYGEDKVDGATHYYAHKKVTPRWASSMLVTAKLTGHTYLK